MRTLVDVISLPFDLAVYALESSRWYRRKRGGTWYNVTPYSEWGVSFWTRWVAGYERVNSVEHWG